MNLKRTIQISRNLSLLLGGAWVVHNHSRRPQNALCPPGTFSAKTQDNSIATVIQNGDIPLTLKQVHVYFRHGARVPLHLSPGLEEVSYPKGMVLKNAPHTLFRHQIVMLPDRTSRTLSVKEESYKTLQLKGGGYAGNMTVLGQDQAYVLGRSLRDMYIFRHRFLSEDYSSRDISVQSTNIDRTIASARCVLAGMFGKERLNQKGGVEIKVCELKDEFLLPNDLSCKVLAETTKFVNSDTDNIGLKEDRLIIEKALGIDSEATGVKINFDHLRDDLTSRVTHGYYMPTALLPYVDMIENNALKTMYYATCGMTEAQRPALTCLSAGRALRRVVDAMESVIDGEKTVKMYLWSTHDTTMVALLEALGIFNWRWPPFVADLRLELYSSDDNRHWVRVLYCSQEMTMRDSATPIIPFEDFQRALKPYMIDDSGFQSLCDVTLEQISNAYSALKHIEVQDPIKPTVEPSVELSDDTVSEAIVESSNDIGEPSVDLLDATIEPSEDTIEPSFELSDDIVEPSEDTEDTEATVEPSEATVESSEDTVELSEDTEATVEPSEATVEPSEDTVKLSEDTEATVELSEDAEVTVEPSDDTVEPLEATVEPSDDTVEPLEDTVEPSEDTEATVELSEDAEVTVEPSEDTTEPSEATVEPSDDTVEPSEDTVEPLEDTVEPSEATVEPSDDTEVTVEPLEDTVEPSEATVEPSDDTEVTVETLEDTVEP